MKYYPVTLPQLSVMTGARGIAGVGLGMLLTRGFTPQQQRWLGWSIFTVGAGIYVTLVVDLLRHHRSQDVTRLHGEKLRRNHFPPDSARPGHSPVGDRSETDSLHAPQDFRAVIL